MKGYVYILKDTNHRYYIGSTDNVKRRMAHHRYGGTLTTRRMKDFEPVLIQEYATLLEAKRIELKLKKFKRRDYIDKIVKDGYIKIKINI